MMLILFYMLTTCFIAHSHRICGYNEEWSNRRHLCIPICEYGNPSCYRRCKEPHFVWKDCETMCPRTCRHPKPVFCGRSCQTGCFCRKGYVYDEINMKCVKVKRCLRTNSVYSFFFSSNNF
ncbi:hypothetical protein WA026_017935 [Henosepilachna vigintioctopunctata]|uniref:TIL domain-containing protein n=1 Tax=Henosepilachna vigintioctopunctata TaxID=420089 RepID=A0AAW1TWI3_9CUCU